jgi:hypothetical protein
MSFLGKLKIKEEYPLILIDAPKDLLPAFGDLTFRTSFAGKEKATQLLFFAKDKKALDAKINDILKALSEDAILWVAYPKKSGAIQSDLIRDEGWEKVYSSDWKPVSSISIDDNWSGIRFKHQSKLKKLVRDVPMEERKVEGIDFVNRTAKLPQDAINMMKPYKGLEVFFDTLSFTHKKEYVTSIVEAKKPETRLRRIEKMIEMVLKLKEQKETKKK